MPSVKMSVKKFDSLFFNFQEEPEVASSPPINLLDVMTRIQKLLKSHTLTQKQIDKLYSILEEIEKIINE